MFETVLSLIGLILTGAGLICAGRQIHQTQRIARGEFLLHLDELLQQHIEIHMRLEGGFSSRGALSVIGVLRR